MKMKVVIPLLILMSLLITETVAQDTPGPPTNFTVTAGDRQIKLTWTHPSNINKDNIDRYRVRFHYAGESLTQETLWPNHYPAAFTENPSHTLRYLTNGTELTFTIAAVNENNQEGTISAAKTGTPNMPAPADFKATLDDSAIGDRTVTLSWTGIPQLPFTTANRDVTDYEYSQNGGAWTSIGSTNTTYIVSGLENGRSYTFRVRGVRIPDGPAKPSGSRGLPSRTVTVLPLIDALGAPGTLNVERVEDTAILTWSSPSGMEGCITRYEYSDDGGSTWQSTGSTDTTYTVTELEPGETYTFLVRAVCEGEGTSRIISHPSNSSNAAVLKFLKRRIIQECPVGWQRSDRFGGPTQRVLLYEVKLQMDLQNRISIYKPDWVAIYVHPDEGLGNLEGWKLHVAVPYNHHREYLLTTENSVVVDAGFVEGGFAFIENPEEDPFPMVGMGFTGATVPGFDYRLYDDSGRKVDFGIACYKRGGIFQALKDMEDPRVLRNVLLESLDWDAAIYIRSEWTVPTPAPAAPSLVKKTVVGTWANLKKQ